MKSTFSLFPGATVTVIIGVGYTEGTIAAAVVAMIYTSIGGLWSVAITDVAQLSFVFLGLVSKQQTYPNNFYFNVFSGFALRSH